MMFNRKTSGAVLSWVLAMLGTLGALPCSALSAESLQAREEAAIKAALARVAPSVVRIDTVGGLERIGELLVGTGSTTGLVVGEDGWIISSAFNFAQKPDSIVITLPDGARRAARLVATDHSRMLVLLKVDVDRPLTVPQPVPAAEMRVGQWSLAVGRTFEVREPNLSVGIVSALDRIWGKAVQTDAKISPNNYGGPLVDIAGRVYGVLVPMSPQGTGSEVAGIEWYDSGIGFAVPLETVLRVLPQLQAGHDLESGQLGVSLKGSDIYGPPAALAAVRASSPAGRAGFKAGDTIVAAAGRPVTRAAELKHALGPLYAGEKINIVVTRGDQRLEREVELVAKVEAFDAPFLGVLPMRPLAGDKAAAASGVEVRYVYPESPAAEAGIQVGDRLTSFGEQKVERAADIAARLQSMAPGQKVTVEVVRGAETLKREVTLARLPESLPGELPPAHQPDGERPAAAADAPRAGVISLKIPEFVNECMAYVPESYDPRRAYGVVVWLQAPGEANQDELLARWRPLCEKYDFVLLAPRPAEQTQWLPNEAKFVRRVLDDVIKTYTIDASRVVVHGHQGGGALAYVLATSNEDVIRAVAAVDAPLPKLLQTPEVDPIHPLAFYTTLSSEADSAPATQAGVKRLREAKFSVVVKDTSPQARDLTPEELAELVRWFDTLDRL